MLQLSIRLGSQGPWVESPGGGVSSCLREPLMNAGEDLSPVNIRRRAATFAVPALIATVLALIPQPVTSQSLRVSAASMDLQNEQASQHGFTFVRNPEQLDELVKAGTLVGVSGNQDFMLKEVSYPYARPEVLDFIERLGEGYREACGEQLVVTSLTRPRNRQPRNASRRSVHPTGMAMDLRRSWDRNCRSWLELTLLTLEANGILDAMLESSPPHFHIALFPSQYRRRGIEILEKGEQTHYEVSRGDTLWKIAKRYRTDVFSVKKINGLRSSQIYVGQVLKLPTTR